MSHTNPVPRRTWPWVVAVLVAVVAVVVGASVISSVVAAPHAAPSTTGRAAAPTSTPIAAPGTSTSTSTPSSSPSHAKTHLTAADVAGIEGAIEDNDPTELYPYLSDPVHVAFAASDFHSDRSRDNAVTDLDYINGTTGWNWKVDDATLAQFRAGAYGASFPIGAIVGESAEGYVISFVVTKAKVTAIFVSKTVALVTAAAQ